MSKINLLLIGFIAFSIGIQSQNSLTIEEIKIQATFEHISVHVEILGDDNLNSTMEVYYRFSGTDNYHPAAKAMRAHPNMIVDGNNLNMNFHAASVMFLDPNSFYDIQINISDPDGGTTQINETTKTKAFPTPAKNGQIKFVIPGNGGGTGTSTDPFLGLQSASNSAAPGDIFDVAPGIYSTFIIDKDGIDGSPITFKSTTLHGAIIDGNNTSSGIITIGNFSDSTQHIIIDGFLIRNGHRAVDAQNTQFLSIQNNIIEDVDYAMLNRRENGWEHDQFIYNNQMTGRTSWPQSGIPNERAVDIRGNRNVVSHNTITDFADGISTDGPPYQTSYALDIHHNAINRIVDDLIEIDGCISNTRVYANRCFNGRAGISLAPIFGGPVYIFRNVIVNTENSPFKMNRGPAGLYIVNNTAIKSENGMSSSQGWQNTFLKNNSILGTRYCFEEFGLVIGSTDDWDYNAYYSARNGTSSEPWFKWDNDKYDDVVDLQNMTAIEAGGISIDPSDFNMVSMPMDYETEIHWDSINALPTSNSTLINSSINLDNINGPFVTDGFPDRGALEVGMPTPQYGHDFSNVCNTDLPSMMTWQGDYNSSWFLPNNWSPCGIPNEDTEVWIPSGKSHYPKVNSGVTIGNLQIDLGAKLNIYRQGNLFVIKE